MKREEVEKLKVPEIKALIRKHNLHTTYIKGYSKLKKAELVREFIKYYPKRNQSPGGGMKMKDEKNPKAKAKPSKRPKKDTATEKLVPGINQPLYKKGVAQGAREQFERAYGKQGSPAKQQKKKRGDVDASNIVEGGRRRRRPARFD